MASTAPLDETGQGLLRVHVEGQVAATVPVTGLGQTGQDSPVTVVVATVVAPSRLEMGQGPPPVALVDAVVEEDGPEAKVAVEVAKAVFLALATVVIHGDLGTTRDTLVTPLRGIRLPDVPTVTKVPLITGAMGTTEDTCGLLGVLDDSLAAPRPFEAETHKASAAQGLPLAATVAGVVGAPPTCPTNGTTVVGPATTTGLPAPAVLGLVTALGPAAVQVLDAVPTTRPSHRRLADTGVPVTRRPVVVAEEILPPQAVLADPDGAVATATEVGTTLALRVASRPATPQNTGRGAAVGLGPLATGALATRPVTDVLVVDAMEGLVGPGGLLQDAFQAKVDTLVDALLSLRKTLAIRPALPFEAGLGRVAGATAVASVRRRLADAPPLGRVANARVGVPAEKVGLVLLGRPNARHTVDVGEVVPVDGVVVGVQATPGVVDAGVATVPLGDAGTSPPSVQGAAHTVVALEGVRPTRLATRH